MMGRAVGLVLARGSGVLPLNKLYESERVIAFRHPQPSYPVHVLIVPKQVRKDLMQLTAKDATVLADVALAAQEIVRELGLEAKGYRLIANGGAYQDVQQLHFHLISGDES
ncbi:MAG: HIT domain-containing protein [Chloroflexota bacterium]|nr:HIT domain-containing protein [Chloroflexota bacterium]